MAVGIVALASLGLSLGCQSFEDCAQETFSKQFSCPKDSVAVRERKDVDGWAVTHDPPTQPPKEVEDDPARLQVWKQDQADQRAEFNRLLRIYEAKGCNHEALYNCFRPDHSNGNNAGASNTWCSPLGPAK